MEDFIREKIKDKPLNKKKIAIKLAISAACGLVFALTSVIVFAIALPRITDSADKELVAVSSESESETLQLETEVEVNLPVDVNYNFSVGDYQRIQNEIYSIGSSASKSIVNITSVTGATDIFNNSYETEGQGVGLIVGDNGKQLLILTEKSFIESADRLSVTFANDTIVDAVAVKYDSISGIAIVSVDKSLLDDNTKSQIVVAKLSTASSMSRGSLVIALQKNYSIFSGTVTSTSNEVSACDNNYSVITTDIAGAKKESGILINLSGEVVGFELKGLVSSDDTIVAVAVSDLIPIINMLENGLDIPYLGTTITTVTDKIANRYNIPKGVYIKEVVMDSPAFEAGIQSGDVVTEINNKKVSSVTAYNEVLLQLKPGETYDISIKRKGSNGYTEITCQVKIGVLN